MINDKEKQILKVDERKDRLKTVMKQSIAYRESFYQNDLSIQFSVSEMSNEQIQSLENFITKLANKELI